MNTLESTDPLSAEETAIMKHTFKAAMLRAAAIINQITQDDVANMCVELRLGGATIDQLIKIDRASIAAAHLKACAEFGDKANEHVVEILERTL